MVSRHRGSQVEPKRGQRQGLSKSPLSYQGALGEKNEMGRKNPMPPFWLFSMQGMERVGIHKYMNAFKHLYMIMLTTNDKVTWVFRVTFIWAQNVEWRIRV